MNVTAIIAEYNPLHSGHVYHIEKSKKITNSDAIICVLSGNYVQRGLPAIIDKWNRTKMALASGVDLVIELPVVYSLSSAEFFSFGAVSLLNSLGIVNNICFGSELGEIDLIKDVAKTLSDEPLEFKNSLKSILDKGFTYPVSRSKALIEYLESNIEYSKYDLESFLNSSNNILAIEYCKSLLKLNSSIKPYTIKRQGGSYNSDQLNNKFSSATSIRKFIKDTEDINKLERHMPITSLEIIKNLADHNYKFVFEDLLLPFIKHKYFTYGKDIINLPDVSEGLHNRIYKYLSEASNYQSLIENIKTKRYTYTRISRILCQYYVGFDQFDTKKLRALPCPYARVLGFNKIGTKILKQAKSNASIPIHIKLPRELDDTLELDIQATKSYSLINNYISPLSDYLISPIKVL